MPLRPPAGFIRPGYDPLKVPDAPTGATATGGDQSASVSFTPPANVGGSAVSAYYAVSNPDQITGTAASSPVSVTGLTNGTPYTFTVWALNTYGPGPFSAASGSVTPAVPEIGLFAGGQLLAGTRLNVINKIIITTSGNSTDFGDLTLVVNDRPGGCGSSVRGVFGGGTDSAGNPSNTINYVTFTTTGNASDFGDLTEGRSNIASASNSTRGIFAGGVTNANVKNIIDYITIASTGNATDFGDLVGSPREGGAGLANSTRAVFSNGSGFSNLEYITISSTGDATDFGDQVTGIAAYEMASGANSTRGILAGGVWDPFENAIQYITIASTGNALDFGDLTVARGKVQGVSGTIKMAIGGGSISGSSTNVIDTITIASTGNATDFGDLISNAIEYAACSNAHGGL